MCFIQAAIWNWAVFYMKYGKLFCITVTNGNIFTYSKCQIKTKKNTQTVKIQGDKQLSYSFREGSITEAWLPIAWVVCVVPLSLPHLTFFHWTIRCEQRSTRKLRQWARQPTPWRSLPALILWRSWVSRDHCCRWEKTNYLPTWRERISMNICSK